MSDTVRNVGFEADIDSVLAITPVAYTTSSTPIVSSAIDRTSYPRKRALVLVSCKADATSTGVTPTVTECATSGGGYTAATVGAGTFAATNSAVVQVVSVKWNAAKPFMKVTATPAGGSGVVSAEVLFIGDPGLMLRLSFATEPGLDGNTLSGIAYRFGQRTLVEGRWVQFARGAFEEALASPKTDVRALFQHDPAMLLGRQSNGTVTVSTANDGLHYSIDLPDTSYANDIKALVARGDLNEMSFGIVPGQVRRSTAEDGKRLELHLSVKELFDVSPVSMPAFGGTTVQMHALTHEAPSLPSQLAMARHRARYSLEGVAR